MIPYFDIHCDTLEEAYLNNYSLFESPLHISLDKCKKYKPYKQVLAIWSDNSLSDEEAYKRYTKIIEHIKSSDIQLIKNKKDLFDKDFLLSIEDARICEGSIERIEEFKRDGVRIITLLWKGSTCIGGGWNTSLHLTEFGEKFVKKCFLHSIIPDISHCSFETADDIIKMAKEMKKPIIASHSNSYSVCSHRRNLRDDTFIKIRDMGGLVGISLVSEHLTSNAYATISNVIEHIIHYLRLGGEETVALGCDFDGTSNLPKGIFDISSIHYIYNILYKKLGKHITYKIFYDNAYKFFQNNLE